MQNYNRSQKVIIQKLNFLKLVSVPNNHVKRGKNMIFPNPRIIITLNNSYFSHQNSKQPTPRKKSVRVL